MDIQAYISSGILESYVLGQTSVEEGREVIALADKFPAIRIELERIELTLQKYARLNRKEPSEEVRKTLFARLDESEKESQIKWSAEANKRYQPKNSGKIWQLLTLLLIISFSGAVGYIIWQNNMLKVSQKNSTAYHDYISHLKDSIVELSNQEKNIRSSVEVLMTGGNKIVTLQGTEKKPEAKATVIYNQQAKKILINIGQLTPPTDITQYQLWGIVNGKPVDLGLLTLQPAVYEFYEMKPTENCQAFVVTVEPMGGSTIPTLEQMVMSGKVN